MRVNGFTLTICHGSVVFVGAARFQGAKLSHRDTFFASLICNVSEDCRLLRCYEEADGVPFSWARCSPAFALVSLLRTAYPYISTRTDSAHFDPWMLSHWIASITYRNKRSAPSHFPCCVRHGQIGGRLRDSEAAIERCAQPQIGPSRHPDIERFITSVCNMVQPLSFSNQPLSGIMLHPVMRCSSSEQTLKMVWI